MKKQKSMVLLLIFAMALSLLPQSAFAAKKKVKLNKKTVTVNVGKTVKIKLQNNKKKVKWTVTSGKKNVTLSKKKKTGVTIKGMKAGKAKVQAKVGKKKYVCKVTVKKVNASTNKNNSTKAGTTSSTGGTTKQPAQKTNEVANPIVKNGVTTWTCVWFGKYYQSNSSTKEPIKWRVLSLNGKDAFLLADQNLDAKPYNEESADVTWATCTLRTWLNGTFLNTAFTSAEQAAIKNTAVVNSDNQKWGTKGGENTTDKVYLLSIAEASNTAYGFDGEFEATSETRKVSNTAYAKEHGVWASTDSDSEYWWLRSPGEVSNTAAQTFNNGLGYYTGDFVNNGAAVRPVLHLDLSNSALWSYAGEVKAGSEE